MKKILTWKKETVDGISFYDLQSINGDYVVGYVRDDDYVSENCILYVEFINSLSDQIKLSDFYRATANKLTLKEAMIELTKAVEILGYKVVGEDLAVYL